MHQIQSIIDRIRIVLASERYEDSPEIRNLAQDFYELTKQLNDRLRRCGEYLRQGLRAEALHEAESEPKLLESTSVWESFNDEECHAWNDLCEFLNLPIVEPMFRDIAFMIDEAYSEHAPLEKLLRQHRRLALQRAPLSARLKVVRELAEQDANAEYWSEDVTRYEEARLAQITEELKAQKKKPSSSVLRELAEELNSPDWMVTPPSKMISALRTLQRDANRADARVKLTELERTLKQACSATNFAQGRDAYAEWKKVIRTAEFELDDELIVRNKPVVEWFEEQIKKEAQHKLLEKHVQHIEDVLEDPDHTREQLEALVDDGETFDEPLPSPLRKQLKNRIQSMRARETMRKLLIGGGIGTTVVVLISSAVLMAVWTSQASFRKQTTQQLAELLQQGNIEEASNLVQQFDGRWQSVKEWSELKKGLVKAQDAIATRKTRLDELLRLAESVGDDRKQFEQILEQANQVVSEKPPMDELNRLFEQKKTQLIADRRTRQTQREGTWSEQVAAQETVIKNLKETYASMEQHDFELAVSGIQQKLKLVAAEPELPGAVAAQVTQYLGELQNIEKDFSKLALRKRLIADLRKQSQIAASPASVPEIANYVNVMAKGADAIKPDPIEPELRESSREADAWKSLFAVQQLLPTDPSKLFPTDQENIKRRKAEFQRIVHDHPLCPLRDAVASAIALLDRLEQRATAIAKFQHDYLETAKMSGLYTVQEKEKRPYYITDNKQLPDSNSITIRRWRIDDELKSVNINPKNYVNLVPAPAPQLEVTERMKSSISVLTHDNWDEICQRLIKSVFYDSGVDPILRLEILSELCEAFAAADVGFAGNKAFQAFVTKVKAARSSVGTQIDWADPLSETVHRYRKIAAKEMEVIEKTDVSKFASAESNVFKEIAQIFSARYEAIGFMAKEGDRPSLDVTLGNRRLCDILVSIPQRMSESNRSEIYQFAVVGRCDENGKVVPSESLPQNFRTGRLLFVKKSSD